MFAFSAAGPGRGAPCGSYDICHQFLAGDSRTTNEARLCVRLHVPHLHVLLFEDQMAHGYRYIIRSPYSHQILQAPARRCLCALGGRLECGRFNVLPG